MKDQDDEKFFVSRRGKQVGVHQVDLTGIDIDSETPSAESDAKPRKQPTKQRASQKKSNPVRARWTRKKTVIATMITVLLLLPVAFAELVVAQYNDGVVSAKRDLKALVDSSVVPAQKKSTISADQIREITNKVNDIVGKMCRGGLLDNAAGLYPRASAALASCHENQGKYAALVTSLYALEADARYLEKLDAVMRPVATPITDEYAVLDSQQTAWRAAHEGIKKLSPTSRMQSAHSTLSAKVGEVADAWSKLNIANNNQDAAGFEESEKALTSGYEAVRSSGEAFAKVLAETQAKVTADYNVLK